MLVFTRKVGDQILIGEDIELTVEKIGQNHVDIGVSAPLDVTIRRAELEMQSRNSPDQPSGKHPINTADDLK